ncbi:MAG: creatininase family protein [Desulfurococcales archaeon]|nr:creatininase family protein [Desulfurococcales archaeon]
MPVDLRLLTAFDSVEGMAALVPLGSVEQHCHLPVGLDCIIAERLAWLSAARAEELLAAGGGARIAVAPPICYGFSPEWRGAPGTVTLPLGVYAGLVESVVEGLASWGFQAVILFNGHGGNSHPARAAASEAAHRLGARVAVLDYWRPPGLRLGHACEVEEALARELGVAPRAAGGGAARAGCERVDIHRGGASLYQGPPPRGPAWAPGGRPAPLAEVVEANARAIVEVVRWEGRHAI